ncbi:MAG: SRPBCC domain-containing protein [Planctomycetaceae bacterium]|nr:SRPBCC domain-containing protein [Planctomycetota bacterium]NUN53340.1 SRPBCC domain-containing protein [Planctomycetaceae bacterium]
MTAKEGAPPRLVSKVFIRGSVEAVWREITKTDSLQGAVFNARLHTPGLRKGAPLQMRTKDGRRVLVVGEVLEWDPPRRFSHTFRFTTLDDPPCRVIYELEPVEGGVEFTLRVEDCPPGTKTEKEMTGGAPFITGNLRSLVETGRLPLGTRVMYALFGCLGFLLPKRTRAENWPMGGGR